ncbi:MAG TPA: hypothetical protein VHM67_14225 [Gemmatimonadaceae bacterium]|nr:hypothetical protein [Gemmatimonadaceae bacterium]
MRAPRRDYRSLATSFAIHIVVGALLLHMTIGRISTYFSDAPRAPRPAPEKLSYVEIVPRGDSTRAQVDGGDNRRATPNVATATPLQAPVSVPTTLPPDEKPRVAEEPGGSGPLVGGGGPLRGVQPSFGDGRVWPGPTALITVPKTDKERADSVLAARLARYNDSLSVAGITPDENARPSWVVEKNGMKWGVDEKLIHLGKFSLPSGVLAALNLDRWQEDPNRTRASLAMRREIVEQSRRRLNEEEFKAAVKAIRERKERERREAETARNTAPVANGY